MVPELYLCDGVCLGELAWCVARGAVPSEGSLWCSLPFCGAQGRAAELHPHLTVSCTACLATSVSFLVLMAASYPAVRMYQDLLTQPRRWIVSRPLL